MNPTKKLKSTAYHEAGHAAADLILGHGSIVATISPKGDTLGSAKQLDGDYMTAEGMSDLVVALYAGAEAEKHVNPDHEAVKIGASNDDEKAADYLALLNRSEEELREKTAGFISDHWELVELIASELLIHESLSGDELDIMLWIYEGEATKSDLEELRARMPR